MIPRIITFGDRFAEGMELLRRGGRIGSVLGLTLLIWAIMFLTNLTLALGLDLEVPAAAGLLVLVLVYLGVIPGLMPGQVGPFYFFARYSLEQFGVDTAASMVFAVLLHAVVVLTPMLGAGAYLVVSRKGIRYLQPVGE